jgi:Rrf2 family iron-sulfur cluster assembly transcriptional regulator
MSVLFSRQCEYALQAVLYLALKEDGERVATNDLTKRLKIPYHFLGKILQSLTKKGLLCSAKGPRGGFSLAKPAEQITLYDIVEAIDGTAFTRSCVLGFPECSGKNPCSVHDTWAGMRESIHEMLVKKDIAQMARDTKKPEYRSKR